MLEIKDFKKKNKENDRNTVEQMAEKWQNNDR